MRLVAEFSSICIETHEHGAERQRPEAYALFRLRGVSTALVLDLAAGVDAIANHRTESHAAIAGTTASRAPRGKCTL